MCISNSDIYLDVHVEYVCVVHVTIETGDPASWLVGVLDVNNTKHRLYPIPNLQNPFPPFTDFFSPEKTVKGEAITQMYFA